MTVFSLPSSYCKCWSALVSLCVDTIDPALIRFLHWWCAIWTLCPPWWLLFYSMVEVDRLRGTVEGRGRDAEGDGDGFIQSVVAFCCLHCPHLILCPPWLVSSYCMVEFYWLRGRGCRRRWWLIHTVCNCVLLLALSSSPLMSTMIGIILLHGRSGQVEDHCMRW